MAGPCGPGSVESLLFFFFGFGSCGCARDLVIVRSNRCLTVLLVLHDRPSVGLSPREQSRNILQLQQHARLSLSLRCIKDIYLFTMIVIISCRSNSKLNYAPFKAFHGIICRHPRLRLGDPLTRTRMYLKRKTMIREKEIKYYPSAITGGAPLS